MKQMLDGRSDPLKKSESNILQLNVTNSVFTDNKERESDFKGIDCTSENNNLLTNACFENITDNWKLRSWKTEHVQRLCQVQKMFIANPWRMSKRLERVM